MTKRSTRQSAKRKKRAQKGARNLNVFLGKNGKWYLAVLILLAVSFFMSKFSPSEPAPVISPQALGRVPHDTTAFTQGLLIENGKLYESTGQYGKSIVRRVNLQTGETEEVRRLGESFFGEGLAALNGRLYQLTWKQRKSFVYDQATLTPLDTLTIPTREGWGLTEDGTHLILSDGSDRLYFLDPTNLEIVRQVEVRDGREKVRRLNELEYVGGLIYANVWQNSKIAIIDPKNGRVVGWMNLAWLNVVHSPIDGADVLNGIAYNPSNKRLYITGKLWPALYVFALPSFE